MQFSLVDNKEIQVFLCIEVHDGAVAQWSAVSGIHSRRSCGLSVAAVWNRIGKSIVEPLFFSKRLFFLSSSAFLVFYLHSTQIFFLFFFFPLLSQCDRCPDVPVCIGSWLGCRDCQPWERLTVQGLADHSGGPWTPGAPTFRSARCSC